jgi:hypothetical protein
MCEKCAQQIKSTFQSNALLIFLCALCVCVLTEFMNINGDINCEFTQHCDGW